MMILSLLERRLHTGTLSVQMPDGITHTLGEGMPQAHIVVHRRDVLRRIARDPELELGETYMDGGWEPGEGGLLAVFALAAVNQQQVLADRVGLRGVVSRLRHHAVELNNARRSRANVHHHYDIDEQLFRGFLDQDMQYSCAYFSRPGMTLDEAQTAKREHIARKLLLRAGQRVLDIGCGWGGMALHLAEHYGVEVVGLTLADDQLRVAQARARAARLEDRVQFRLQDYRLHQDQYDAIVSVGMFEHVGRPQYQVYFDAIERMLKPDGRALIHTIGRTRPPTVTDAWIRKHIFPGGYIPALSEVSRRIERSGLILSDLEVLRLHYAKTLQHWHQRFQRIRDVTAERFDERFCRMWEYYLQLSEAAFRWGELVVFQFQLARANDTVPLTRDYLYQTA